MLGNNLANAGTAGFKADHEFYGLYTSPEWSDAIPPDLPNIETHWTDYSQGVLADTGNPRDFGLEGRGFFVVQGASGPLLTRNGGFQIAANGQVQTTEGYPLQGDEGKPLIVDPTLPFDVQPDGQVFQISQPIGRVRLVDVTQSQELCKQGASYFQVPASVALQPASRVQVHQGKLEAANVPTAESAVKLVSVMRQFEALQRAVTMGNEMNKRAVEEVARVTA